MATGRRRRRLRRHHDFIKLLTNRIRHASKRIAQRMWKQALVAEG